MILINDISYCSLLSPMNLIYSQKKESILTVNYYIIE